MPYTGRLRLKGVPFQVYERVGISLVEVYNYFEEGCRKKGNMGYDQCTVPNTLPVKLTFVAYL